MTGEKRRFEIEELEERIAPTAEGLCVALDAAAQAIAVVDPATVDHILDTINARNPQVPDCN